MAEIVTRRIRTVILEFQRAPGPSRDARRSVLRAVSGAARDVKRRRSAAQSMDSGGTAGFSRGRDTLGSGDGLRVVRRPS